MADSHLISALGYQHLAARGWASIHCSPQSNALLMWTTVFHLPSSTHPVPVTVGLGGRTGRTQTTFRPAAKPDHHLLTQHACLWTGDRREAVQRSGVKPRTSCCMVLTATPPCQPVVSVSWPNSLVYKNKGFPFNLTVKTDQHYDPTTK